MKNIAHTQTVDWSLDRVTAALRTQDQVEGVLVIGSLVEKAFTPASHYDLVIVLREREQNCPVGWSLASRGNRYECGKHFRNLAEFNW